MAAQAVALAAARILGFVFTFAFPLLLVRLVDKAEFGLYRQSFLFVATCLNLLALGVMGSAFYFFPREPERKREIVLGILLYHLMTGLLVGGALWCFPGLVVMAVGSEGLRPHAFWLGVVVFTWQFSCVLETIATAQQDVKASTAFITGANFSKGALMVGATWWDPSAGTILRAAAAQGVLQSIVLLVYVCRRFPGFWRAWDSALLRRQFSYAAPLGLAAGVLTLYEDLHHYFVSHRFDTATYAVYAVGCFQAPFVGQLRDAIGQLMIARVSYLQRFGTREQIVAVSLRVTRWLCVLYFGVFGLLAVVARELIEALYTRKFLDSLPVFYANLTLLLLGITMYDPMLRAYQEQRFYVLRVRLALLGLLAALLYAGLHWMGLLGAVAAVVTIQLLERLIMVNRVAALLGLTRAEAGAWWFIGQIAAVAAVAAAVAAAARWGLAGQSPWAILAACGAVFGLTYGALLWTFRSLGDDHALVEGKLRALGRRFGLGGAPANGTPGA